MYIEKTKCITYVSKVVGAAAKSVGGNKTTDESDALKETPGSDAIEATCLTSMLMAPDKVLG